MKKDDDVGVVDVVVDGVEDDDEKNIDLDPEVKICVVCACLPVARQREPPAPASLGE